MKVEHTFTLAARCPVNNGTDVYTVTVRTDRLIKVEDILEKAREWTHEPIFQEALTAAMAHVLQCEVETVGSHGEVQTKVVCP